MISVVYGGADAFNEMVYGDQHPANQDFFKRQVENISSTLTNVGSAFFASTQRLYDQFNNSESIRLAKAAVRNVRSLFQTNQIRSIFEMPEFQTAPIVMQRWIMANPVVRERYHEQRLDGYSDTYVDMSPGDIGEEHYDYRRAMDGVIVDHPKGGWKATFYMEDTYEGDAKLSHEDKVDIQNTWEVVELFIKAGGRDPTSPFDSSL